MAAEQNACPLCNRPLYGWIALPPAGGEASIGMPLSASASAERVIDRCENCGVAVEHDRQVDLSAEWEAVRPRESGEPIVLPNRASLQAAIGVEGWAGIDLSPGRLLHTPQSLTLLAERNGGGLERITWPIWGRSQAWMWQTLVNGLTLHANFAREVRAGRLRPADGRGRFAFAIDLVVTLLGAPLIALVSFPLEAIAALARRGGEMRAVAASIVVGNGRI